MSLDAIKAMRMAGQKPAGVLWVVVGGRPAPAFDACDTIGVRQGQRPRDMDWRPVVGLPVAVFDLGASAALLAETLDALKAAGAKFFGVASTTRGIVPMTESAGDEHVIVLRRSLELMTCPC